MKQYINNPVLILIILIIISGVILSSDNNFQLIAGQNGSVQNVSHVNSSNKVVVILPHPDDESIGMGGVIQKLKNEGKEVHCVLLASGNGITDKVPLCDNYYGLEIPQNATKAERKKIIREDSFKKVMAIYNCSYELMGLDDGSISNDTAYKIMEDKYREGYSEFYTTTGDYNIDHLGCHNAMKSMLEKYPQLKYRQFPVYWHASPKYKPVPIAAENFTDYDVKEFLPKKKEAFEVYYNIGIFNRGLYGLNVERIYYIN
jgi:LmbE family N-acetylglucosaminyl deacetylase